MNTNKQFGIILFSFFLLAGITCAEGICGDGTIDIGEVCDDGEFNSDVLADACRTDCRDAWCGDGTMDTGEECDEGSSNYDNFPNRLVPSIDPSCVKGNLQVEEAFSIEGMFGGFVDALSGLFGPKEPTVSQVHITMGSPAGSGEKVSVVHSTEATNEVGAAPLTVNVTPTKQVPTAEPHIVR